jgi:hypothetical protein
MEQESLLTKSQKQDFFFRHEIVEWVKKYCQEEGVILTTKTSTHNRIALKCDLGGQYTSKKNQVPTPPLD